MEIDEEEQLRLENEELRKLLTYVQYIMSFHMYRCPMNIPNNFSGSEEHLAMYRDVVEMLKPHQREFDWEEWRQLENAKWARLRQEREERQSGNQRGTQAGTGDQGNVSG